MSVSKLFRDVNRSSLTKFPITKLCKPFLQPPLQDASLKFLPLPTHTSPIALRSGDMSTEPIQFRIFAQKNGDTLLAKLVIHGYRRKAVTNGGHPDQMPALDRAPRIHQLEKYQT